METGCSHATSTHSAVQPTHKATYKRTTGIALVLSTLPISLSYIISSTAYCGLSPTSPHENIDSNVFV
eukprot:2692433-Rhodomonas_salina.2